MGNRRMFRHAALKWLPALAVPALVFVLLYTASNNNISRQLYQRHCASCHLDDGSGLRGIIPALAGASHLAGDKGRLACLVRHGAQGSGLHPMPGNEKLTEAEIANLINFILNEWGNRGGRVSDHDVRAALNACP